VTVLPLPCSDRPEILGASTPWISKGLSRPVMGFLLGAGLIVSMIMELFTLQKEQFRKRRDYPFYCKNFTNLSAEK